MDSRDPSQSEALRGHIATAGSPSDGSDFYLTLATRGLLWNIRSLSSRDLHQTAENKTRSRHDSGPITTRSWPDRRVIMATINRDHGSFIAESSNRSFPLNRTVIIGASISPSTCDRGPIVERSWPRLKWNQRQFTANLGATTSSIETPPTTPSNCAHDRIKWPSRSGKNSL